MSWVTQILWIVHYIPNKSEQLFFFFFSWKDTLHLRPLIWTCLCSVVPCLFICIVLLELMQRKNSLFQNFNYVVFYCTSRRGKRNLYHPNTAVLQSSFIHQILSKMMESFFDSSNFMVWYTFFWSKMHENHVDGITSKMSQNDSEWNTNIRKNILRKNIFQNRNCSFTVMPDNLCI